MGILLQVILVPKIIGFQLRTFSKRIILMMPLIHHIETFILIRSFVIDFGHVNAFLRIITRCIFIKRIVPKLLIEIFRRHLSLTSYSSHERIFSMCGIVTFMHRLYHLSHLLPHLLFHLSIIGHLKSQFTIWLHFLI